MITALECLGVEIDTNWTRDELGRLHSERVPEPAPGVAPYLLWAASSEGTLLEIGSAVPDATAERLRDVYSEERMVGPPDRLPEGAERYQEILAQDVGFSVVVRVPCFVIDRVPDFGLDRAQADGARILRSTDGEVVGRCASMPPTNIDERRGPWAGIVVNNELVSHCSTARSSPWGAEAGTWTDPANRGRGFAAVATAVWASMLLPGERLLFYCTDDWNRSSQAVARRLNLPPIGWMWRLDPQSGIAEP
jgi:hypothetical protein